MARYCFGVDVGGTTVKMGFFDDEGNLLEKWEIPTRTEDHGKHILPDVAESIRNKMKEREVSREDIAGVGIGAPGPIDAKGTVYVAVNLGWGTFSLKNELQSLLNLPVEAGNDANVAALGEMWKGGGQGYSNVVAVTLGTGVGGGIIVDGKILSGATGAGGEIGHIHVMDGEEERCNCGNFGCLEQYTSATGIVRLAKRRLAEDDKPSVLRESGKISAKTVFDAVKSGDELAMEVAERFGQILGRTLAGIAAVVNPEIFVIGGGVSKAGPVLLDYIQKYYTPNAFSGSRGALFSLATLGNDAGIYGAARMVLD
ncbi:MAG TPA: ROK family glucokinase [Candidatus Eisenbergiella intestinipullorum]|nr:ROK family glucokinase [Candidatus Eisenbergiella intestinipullorum]